MLRIDIDTASVDQKISAIPDKVRELLMGKLNLFQTQIEAKTGSLSANIYGNDNQVSLILGRDLSIELRPKAFLIKNKTVNRQYQTKSKTQISLELAKSRRFAQSIKASWNKEANIIDQSDLSELNDLFSHQMILDMSEVGL
ncbi:hypothetical protein [Beijerinckia indica]|uniref:Uncharacterized protein n=1 Tax=Beijerinckia indica subsp. indica (strain ATCC 9039 / DSM 1715 / NCIMB 8712) TaxID=395963 RepID=B2IFS8_BEII9|nr:hypothetical protein [Beijerinckia indica]ACB94289.1 hypothetical protein Bind_0639 [Beijerinckia indica subsp. indica ATCC 9039]